MSFKYIYCIKDGIFNDRVEDIKFSKKNRCYIFQNDFFINELKEHHFFGDTFDGEDSKEFFENHFRWPTFKHLIIENKTLDNPQNGNDFIADVMPRTFTKQSLKDAYIQGYRKRAIMSGLKYDYISELNAVTEFENWYVNLYGA